MSLLSSVIGGDTLLTAFLEATISDGLKRGATRAFTVPAGVVSKLCRKFGVKSAEGQAAVIASFRALGESVGNVITTIQEQRDK